MDSQRTNGAGEPSVIEGTAIEDSPAPSTELVRRERRSEVLHPLDRQQLVASFREYQELCKELLDDSDYQEYTRREKVGGVWRDVPKRFKKKSAWRKLAAAFDLDVSVVGGVRIERDFDGKPIRAAAIARAIAPSGRYMEGTGYCSIDESRFEKDRSKAENDLPATAETRAKNRAISDLLGTGEVSAEEASAGSGDSEPEHDAHAHGPVVTGELKQSATEAVIALCGGDLDQARALWEKLQAELDGYMPEAVARALLLAAQSAAPPNEKTEQEDTGPNAAAISAADDTAARTVAGAPSSSPPPPAANPHGARLRELATARGVEDAELANLIRNAVAQGPIPAERARQVLPTMLERITKEISDHTVELLEMFYPPGEGQGEERASRPETATSVDFGALEPPQAR
jgi:hypothetical protein